MGRLEEQIFLLEVAMLALLRSLIEIDHSITRHFELDYILFDAVFLAGYVSFLVREGRIRPLRTGIVCGLITYLIDGVIWHAAGVREYGISAPWIKHPVDFMMDVSYGIVAFGWVWIAFERKGNWDVALWTLALFGGWLLVPTASRLLRLNDDPIITVRHMESQVWVQITVVIIGYVLLAALRYDRATILYVFAIGCLLTFMMEFSLLVTGIRPSGLKVLIYDTLILTNQGVPYVYVIWDKILPALRVRMAKR
jgi:hypothetical protein